MSLALSLLSLAGSCALVQGEKNKHALLHSYNAPCHFGAPVPEASSSVHRRQKTRLADCEGQRSRERHIMVCLVTNRARGYAVASSPCHMPCVLYRVGRCVTSCVLFGRVRLQPLWWGWHHSRANSTASSHARLRCLSQSWAAAARCDRLVCYAALLWCTHLCDDGVVMRGCSPRPWTLTANGKRS